MSSQLRSWNAPLTHQPAAAIMLIAGAAQRHCGDGAMASVLLPVGRETEQSFAKASGNLLCLVPCGPLQTGP